MEHAARSCLVTLAAGPGLERTAPDPGGKLRAREEAAGALGVHGGHEEGNLARVADAERMHGLDELAAHDGGDAVTVEEGLDHEGLGLIAAAAHLDQARGWLWGWA
jgi:hypothetical protein